MPLQNGSIVYIYYVKAWDSEEDYRNLKPPVKHYLFNEKEGVAFEVKKRSQRRLRGLSLGPHLSYGRVVEGVGHLHVSRVVALVEL